MAQFANPDGTITNTGSWTPDAAATVHEEIDEGITGADDTEVVSDSNPTASETFVVSLQSLTDPVSSAGHIIRARWAKNAGGGANYTGNMELRQGYVSEVSLGTLIATLTSAAISGTTNQNDSHTLSGAEADSITNYADLYLRCWAAKSGGGAGRAFKIDTVEMEVPDAPVGGDEIQDPMLMTGIIPFPRS